MANGLLGYQVEDISDEAQTPDADLVTSPQYLFFPLARISPTVGLHRVSLRSLVAYMQENLSFDDELAVEVEARQQLANLVAQIDLRLTGQTGQNTHNIGELTARVTALEQGSGGASPPQEDTSGMLTYGLKDVNGAEIGDARQAHYPALPATVSLRFPAGVNETDEWYFTFEAGVRVQHIWNMASGSRIEELGTWQYDDDTRTYTFIGGITPTFGGRFSVALVADDD